MSARIISQWWERDDRPVSLQLRRSKIWKDFYQYIPTHKMMTTTLETTVKQTFEEEHPGHDFPEAQDIMKSFVLPNTEWRINFFKSVKNDYNGYNSGKIKINDTVLVQRQGEDGNLIYDPFLLTHVCLVHVIYRIFGH